MRLPQRTRPAATQSPSRRESPRVARIEISIVGFGLFGNLELQSSVGARAFQNARLQKQARKQAEVLLPAALQAYQQGRHAEAQAICRQVLKDLPNHFGALQLLGTSEADCGRFAEAAQSLTRAVG